MAGVGKPLLSDKMFCCNLLQEAIIWNGKELQKGCGSTIRMAYGSVQSLPHLCLSYLVPHLTPACLHTPTSLPQWKAHHLRHIMYAYSCSIFLYCLHSLECLCSMHLWTIPMLDPRDIEKESTKGRKRERHT